MATIYFVKHEKTSRSSVGYNKRVFRAKTGGTVRDDFWLNCKKKKKRNTSQSTLRVQDCHVSRVNKACTTSGPVSRLSGEGEGKCLGVGKEIWRALISAHLKFEFHPQVPRLLLWCWAISEYHQSYLTYNTRSNVNKQLLSFPPPPHMDTTGKGCCG